MAKLTAKQREQLPAKAFGLPDRARSKKARRESGNYPMPDRDHAIERDPTLGEGAPTRQPDEGRVRAHQSEGPQDPQEEEAQMSVSIPR